MDENSYRAREPRESPISPDDHDAINEAEWQTRSNWIGPFWFGIYCSKRDTRLAVPCFPKRSSKLCAFNYAHAEVWRVLVGSLLIGGLFGAALVAVFATALRGHVLAATIVGTVVGGVVGAVTFLVAHQILKRGAKP